METVVELSGSLFACSGSPEIGSLEQQVVVALGSQPSERDESPLSARRLEYDPSKSESRSRDDPLSRASLPSCLLWHSGLAIGVGGLLKVKS